MFDRKLTEHIISQFFQHKVIIIYWPRQVGKTTLSNVCINTFPHKKTLNIVWDDADIQELRKPSLALLNQLTAGYDIIFIDEAQKIKQIGIILKLLVDHFPDKQIIATWSSSFDLAQSITEPLTWRAFIHTLYPLSIQEVYDTKPLSTTELEQRLLFWSYPEVLAKDQSPERYLKSLFDNYLYKDILSFDGIQKHELIIKLIKALALQIGNEFSYHELSELLNSNKDTIAKYVYILEQAFIIKTLPPLYTNQRREIKAHKKVYFLDLGVRNAAINNFNPLSLRNDVWQLWENFCFIERTKNIQYNQKLYNQYFRRQTAWPEIDYIEQSGDQYDCYEFKFSPKKWWSIPIGFANMYLWHNYSVIRSDNYREFIS